MTDDGWEPPAPEPEPTPFNPQEAAVRGAVRRADAAVAEKHALAALEQQLAARPPDPFTAALTKAADKIDRRREAIQGEFAARMQAEAGQRSTAEAHLEVAFRAGGDPRENEDWFQRLPEAERQRLQAHWDREAQHRDDEPKKRWRRTRRLVGQGAGTWLLAGVLQSALLGVVQVPVMLLEGAVCGLLWARFGADRFGFAIIAAVLYCAVHLGAVAACIGGNAFAAIPLIYGMAIVTYAGSWCGHRKELMQAEGSW